jgi:copper(I)-binding protein
LKSLVRSAAVCAALLAGAAAQAQVRVHDAWVRATVPQQQATGAFLHITSATDAKLVQVSTPAAAVAEIHEMAMDGNVMRMRAISALELPAGKTVALQPGGYHLMLMQLKGTLKDGETVPLSLVVETRDGKRQTLDVSAAVRPLNTAAGGHKH